MKKGKIIYVIGVFDLFHRGHVELLRRAKELGDQLLVAVNGDEMVASYKRRPFFSQEDRLVLVAACRYVDEAFLIEHYDHKELIIAHGIDVIVHGDDWAKESYMKQIRVDQAFLDAHGVRLELLPYTAGISTSDLIQQIKEFEC